jgi:hypothetical protein
MIGKAHVSESSCDIAVNGVRAKIDDVRLSMSHIRGLKGTLDMQLSNHARRVARGTH